VRALADPALARQTRLPTLPEAVRSGAWMVGPPERIVEQLLELQDLYPGLEEVHVGQVVGTDERVILEQLERFSREVMPAFKAANAHRPPSIHHKGLSVEVVGLGRSQEDRDTGHVTRGAPAPQRDDVAK